MDTSTKISSLKVGALALLAIIILIFTVLWIKGRSLSAGERIEVIFQDVNGMRAGSAVQMMGFRVGQVEEITPVIAGKDSHVKLRFVITEKGVVIPPVSSISIQQSGLIGEQFLEITPPRVVPMYISTDSSTTNLKKGTPVYMDFGGELKQIAHIMEADVVNKAEVPVAFRDNITTKNCLKVNYIITVPGLILENDNLNAKFANGKFIFYVQPDAEQPKWPTQSSPYTIIEPMRLADFMDLQYKAAKALNDTNDRVSEILSNELISEIQSSVKNVNELTNKAVTTLGKAEALIDSSKADINSILKQTDILARKLTVLTDNVNEIVGDKELIADVHDATKSVARLSNNISGLLEDRQTREVLANIDEISRNLVDISAYVNEFTKDEKLKRDLKSTINNINRVTQSVNKTLENLNDLPQGEQLRLKDGITDALVATRNLKEFSKTLNKRFLLFRLMF
jgi:phospholipid/cholesterol/gamma-HCH transport system substrate-binding protein